MLWKKQSLASVTASLGLGVACKLFKHILKGRCKIAHNFIKGMNSPKEHPQLKRPIEGPTSMSQTDLLSKGLAGEGGPKINPGESSYGSLKWDTHSGQYRIKTARSGMDNSLTMLNEATIRKLTRKATVNTVNASP